MKNEIITKEEQWFRDRISKRVYRKLGSCKCKRCVTISHEGLLILDSLHASYLFLCSQELGIKYQDEPIVENIS